MTGEARTPGGTVIRNKPIMIFLHPNTETYDPAAGASLLVNLGALEGYHDLLDDCTARMKMHKFADKLFTPAGDLIRGECCCASYRVSASGCAHAGVACRAGGRGGQIPPRRGAGEGGV